MSTLPLETAAHPEQLRRVVIEPLSRVEGHGKVTLLLDEDGHVEQARLHIVEFRAFEKFIQGRPYWEVPVMVQRLCGICPVSHHLAACKALDQVVGATTLTPTAEKMRRLMHYGQILQSHALHFFHLVVAGPAVRLRFRRRAPQHRGRRGGLSRHRPAGRAVAQVRPGSRPPHGGQAHPWHGLGARRREQEPHGRRARRAAERHLPDDRVEPRRRAAGTATLRAGPRDLSQLRHVRGADVRAWCVPTARWTSITAACARRARTAG